MRAGVQAEERLVKIRYKSEIAEAALSKKLFGFPESEEKRGTKVYRHKAIVGILEGVPLRRVARATIVLPEPYLEITRSAIKKVGGTIKSVDPVPMAFENSARFRKAIFSIFLAGVIKYLQFASETTDKEQGVSVLKKAELSTRKFTSYLRSVDEYHSDETSGELVRRLASLIAFAQEDFEGAKIEAGLLANDLQNFKPLEQ
jgi:hypothetical protein